MDIIVDLLLAILHHFLVFTLAGLLAAEFALVRPGLSGWAQANGLRGPTTDAQSSRSRIDHDLAYIQNQSLALDLKIIWMTIKSEFLAGSGS